LARLRQRLPLPPLGAARRGTLWKAVRGVEDVEDVEDGEVVEAAGEAEIPRSRRWSSGE
jgi:hypothetical protein